MLRLLLLGWRSQPTVAVGFLAAVHRTVAMQTTGPVTQFTISSNNEVSLSSQSELNWKVSFFSVCGVPGRRRR